MSLYFRTADPLLLFDQMWPITRPHGSQQVSFITNHAAAVDLVEAVSSSGAPGARARELPRSGGVGGGAPRPSN